MLARLGHFVARRRKLVIGVWIALTLIGGYSAGKVSSRWYQSFSIPGYSAYEANVRTFHEFGTGQNAPLVAVFHTKGDITKDAQLEKAVLAAAAVNKGSRTSSYWSTGSRAYVSKDGHTAFAEIYPPGLPTFSSSVHIDQVRAALKAHTTAGVTANLTGRDALEAASSGGNGPSVLTEALIGGLGAIVILMFVFGTLPAVLMPVAVAVASILNTFTLVYLLTYVTNVSIIVQYLIALVGLGVAIDYALLMIFRFRDELREGEDVETALVEMMTHAGRSVIVSGTTVAVGLLSLIVLPLPFIRSIGIGGMLIPAVSVVTAITLLPALLMSLGPRINSLRMMPRRFVDRGHPEDGPWGRWAAFVNRRPWPVAIVGALIVGVLVFYGLQLNPSEAQAKDLPGKGDAIAGRIALANAGISPGVMKPFVVLVENGANPAQIAAKLRTVEGVEGAVAPTGKEWRSDRRVGPRHPGDRHACPPGAERNRGNARRDRCGRPRLRPRRLRQLPVRARVRRASDVRPADARVPVPRAVREGGGPQPDLARGRLRDHRVHLPAGPRVEGDLERRGDAIDHPVDPVDDLRVPVRAVDGLRGVHAHADA
jgi:RND superfamily putative drug exporter